MVVKCLFCDDDGRTHLNLGTLTLRSRCPVCRGRKTIFIPEGKQLCPKCHGIRTIKTRAAGLSFQEDCPICKATGFVDE